MIDYYHRDGRPFEHDPLDDFEGWAKEYAPYNDIENRIVGKTLIADGVEVSPVFLALDHRIMSFDEGPPLIFETKVFGGVYDQEQERYSTENRAVLGHLRWVAKVLLSRPYPTMELVAGVPSNSGCGCLFRDGVRITTRPCVTGKHD